MAVKFNSGAEVRQVMPAPIQGKVVRFVFDETSGDINYIVGWEDENGKHERSFTEDQIEKVYQGT